MYIYLHTYIYIYIYRERDVYVYNNNNKNNNNDVDDNNNINMIWQSCGIDTCRAKYNIHSFYHIILYYIIQSTYREPTYG